VLPACNLIRGFELLRDAPGFPEMPLFARQFRQGRIIAPLARLVRMAGPVSVVAAALIVVSEIVAFLSGGIAPINGVVRVAAFFLLLLGLFGLYARQSAEAGSPGLAGFLLAFLGTMLIAGALAQQGMTRNEIRDLFPRHKSANG
jgi:hypothetical protein